MSRSVDLFVDSERPLAEVAETVAEAVAAAGMGELQISPDENGTAFRLRGLLDGGTGLEAVLSEHAYLDDGELWLSRYRYVLSVSVPGDEPAGSSAGVRFLRQVAAGLRGRLRVLLVLDLQNRLPVGDDDLPEGMTV